jgi:glycerol-3-phosphate dehydrogenase
MGLECFNKRSRAELFRNLSSRRLDLLVIGGGITGAAIFRDAALRGMRVGLVEAHDFASGSSGRSSKLIHGGLRYLKNLGFRVAWESCHERNLHIRLNKRLVRPLPFLVPLYDGRGSSRAQMRVGMLAYDLLSGLRNHRLHRFLSREETLTLAPGIPVAELKGGCIYYDALVSDNRWTLEIIKDGVRNGGVALNYAPVTALLKVDGKISGARVEDRNEAGSYEVSARSVVNATGVFSDQIRRMDRPDASQLVRLSKGTHFVFREEDVPLGITTVFSSPLDGRPLFLVKRDGCFLYGTSDEWEGADPASPAPGERDVNYLLESLQLFMPEARLGPEKVQFVYSGFRPLLFPESERQDASKATREDLVEVSPSGLVSVVGGKLTTARITACRVLDKLVRRLDCGKEWSPCRTHKLSIAGSNDAVAERFSYWVRQRPGLTGYIRVLCQRYGVDADEICREAVEIFVGRHADRHADTICAEVQYVCRREMVCALEDLMDRRAGFLYWNRAQRLERLRYGASLIRKELGLSKDEFEAQFAAYEKHLDRFHSLPKCPRAA